MGPGSVGRRGEAAITNQIINRQFLMKGTRTCLRGQPGRAASWTRRQRVTKQTRLILLTLLFLKVKKGGKFKCEKDSEKNSVLFNSFLCFYCSFLFLIKIKVSSVVVVVFNLLTSVDNLSLIFTDLQTVFIEIPGRPHANSYWYYIMFCIATDPRLLCIKFDRFI